MCLSSQIEHIYTTGAVYCKYLVKVVTVVPCKSDTNATAAASAAAFASAAPTTTTTTTTTTSYHPYEGYLQLYT
jgi:hypothetical protein